MKIWHDFNLDSLNACYGNLLDQALDAGFPVHNVTVPIASQFFENVAIADSGDVKHQIVWNHDMVRLTLATAQTFLSLNPGAPIFQTYSNAAGTSVAHIPNSRLTVDHTVGLSGFPRLILLVGLTRPSWKWSGHSLAEGLPNVNLETLWPVRQLGNLCSAAKTRYGYLQTNEELVVCCFGMDGGGRRTVMMMPIAWTLHGEDQLTTDLALWWLGLMAMSSSKDQDVISSTHRVDAPVDGDVALHADSPNHQELVMTVPQEAGNAAPGKGDLVLRAYPPDPRQLVQAAPQQWGNAAPIEGGNGLRAERFSVPPAARNHGRLPGAVHQHPASQNVFNFNVSGGRNTFNIAPGMALFAPGSSLGGGGDVADWANDDGEAENN